MEKYPVFLELLLVLTPLIYTYLYVRNSNFNLGFTNKPVYSAEFTPNIKNENL